MANEETYLGDSISVTTEPTGTPEWEAEFGRTVALSKEHSDGSRTVLRLDPSVLDELLTWLEDRTVWRAKRAPNTCSTCRWWLAGEMDRARGVRGGTCTRRANGPYPGFSTETMDFSTRQADLYTDSDFGCIRWEWEVKADG